MNRSTKYNFYLPQNTDLIDPSDFDYNFEIIDENLITESQTFTDTQKNTARTNIGAASAVDLGSPSSASNVTGSDAFTKISNVNGKFIYSEVGTFDSESDLAGLLNTALSTAANNEMTLIRAVCGTTFGAFYTGVTYFIELKKSSNNYASCEMQGLGVNTAVIGTKNPTDGWFFHKMY